MAQELGFVGEVGDVFFAGEVVFALVEEAFVAGLLGGLSELLLGLAFNAALVSFLGGHFTLSAGEGAVLDREDFCEFASEGFALVAGADLDQGFHDVFDGRGVLELGVDGEEGGELRDIARVEVVEVVVVEEGLEFVHGFCGGFGGDEFFRGGVFFGGQCVGTLRRRVAEFR